MHVLTNFTNVKIYVQADDIQYCSSTGKRKKVEIFNGRYVSRWITGLTASGRRARQMETC
jgi:hypothetical protein